MTSMHRGALAQTCRFHLHAMNSYPAAALSAYYVQISASIRWKHKQHLARLSTGLRSRGYHTERFALLGRYQHHMERKNPRNVFGDRLRQRAVQHAQRDAVTSLETSLTRPKTSYEDELAALELLSSAPVTSISSFMALVAALNCPFKPISLHRPWSVSAGAGATASVEVHRYVPGRNFDLFNDSALYKLRAYQPDAKKTGDYYAIKRLKPLSENGKKPSLKEGVRHFARLATELRILAHPDLRGHPNIVYLFGVSHSPSQDHSSLSEPNFVLQEGDCGDLLHFCRAPNMHTMVEVKMSLCFDIASGLQALHKHGVAHTDLKPQNILVRRRHGRKTSVYKAKSASDTALVAVQALTGESPYVAMLADFSGSVIFSDSKDGKMTKGMYTPLWCAPELYLDDKLSKETLMRADIYSAGLIFAFIFMEGRDIFTKMVDHGMLHAEDTTLSPSEVKRLKLSDGVIKLAQEEVTNFETCLFAVMANGDRVYLNRETMYAPPYLVIFNAILVGCLSVNPHLRVADASEMLRPWKMALHLEFHTNYDMHYGFPELFRGYYRGNFGNTSYYKHTKLCARSDGHCVVVPAALKEGTDTKMSGVFDIQQGFSIFTTSITSGLKTELLVDLMREANLAKTILEKLSPPQTMEQIVSTHALRKAAECSYQVGLAFVEGFGITQSRRAALYWTGLAAQLGHERAMAAYLPMFEAIGHVTTRPRSSTSGMGDYLPIEQAYDYATKAVVAKGYPATAACLAEKSSAKFAATVHKYREVQAARIWKDFHRASQCDQGLFSGNLSHLKTYFQKFPVDYNLSIGNGWTILHYAAYSGSLVAVQKLVQFWGGDIRTLSLKGETAFDIAVEAGHDETVQYLLSEHEKLDPPFERGSCPLQNICLLPVASVRQTVQRILKMKSPLPIDARNIVTGHTALLHSLSIEAPIDPAAQDTAIRTLLQLGANPLLTTPEAGKASALMLAVLQLRYETVKVMLKYIADHGHTTPLIDLRRRRPEPANELARSFFYLMQKKSRSHRLAIGVKEGDSKYAKLIALLTTEEVAREIPYATNAKDHNPLSLACYYGNAEAAELIVANYTAAGISMAEWIKSEGSMQALHTAIDCGYSYALDVLYPLMMTRPDISEWNALESALHHQHKLVPKIFSYYEAEGQGAKLLEYRDPWGASALDTALEYGYLDLAKFLIEKGATYDVYRLNGDHSIDSGKQSTLASVIPHMKKIKFLMGLEPAPGLVVTESGLNVFHILAADAQLIGVTVGSTEFQDVMKYFHEIDNSLIHARGGIEGMTPLHVVSLNYSQVVGEFLLAWGANINAVDDSGYTPLDYLDFHAKGDQVPAGQQLTIDYKSSSTTHVGHTICDYTTAGPVYHLLEEKLLRELKAQYKSWGAKTGAQVREAAKVTELEKLKQVAEPKRQVRTSRAFNLMPSQRDSLNQLRYFKHMKISDSLKQDKNVSK